ncbi:M56 family metallopeptidase [Caldanaerobacter subterraneus]|uniref:Bla regulator protein BlaR1 n=1 Tax=Caldanaerobacter subterraneus TaxID=911092 RepID=A0A4R2JIL3_9THEO|nr:M56 family metallopeptidase [Caldanaerobacter subterraneus]TCO53965.1 bla regulator protein BlaR1 [Caldanaerobacter subterraneus]
MEKIFYTVFLISIQASIVGLFIVLVKRILNNKISPEWHYALWVVLILKLILPFGPESALSFFNLMPQVEQSVDFLHYQSYQENIYNRPVINDRFEKDNISIVDESTRLSDSKNEVKILAYIWITVAMIFFTFIILSSFVFHKKIKRRGKSAPDSLYSILEKCKERMYMKNNIKIVVQDVIKVPAIFGIFKPYILISPEILKLNEEEISYIFIHELAHLKRKDLLVNYLLLVLQILHWFNPFIWYFFKKIRQDMEVAADWKVLDILENNERKKYGRTLITVLEGLNTPHISFKLVGMMDDKSNIERRIEMIKIMDIFKNRKRFFVITGLIVFIILTVFLLTNPTSKTLLQIGYYTIEIPTDWKVKTDTPGLITEKNTILKIITTTRIISSGELVFEKDNVPVGGVQIIGYEPNQLLFLPNHSEVKSKKEIEGLITKAVLVNLDITPPAATGDNSIKNENHIYLIFEEDGIAYDIYADVKYVNESQLIKIAKSFKPAPDYEVKKVVEGFGKRLKNVDKLAPKEGCRELIKENYSQYVSQDLLAEWIRDPSKAPGKYVSSPWPDRIDIKDITKIGQAKFLVTGDIVEITSVPGEEWRTGVTLTVEKLEGKWLITGIDFGSQLQTQKIENLDEAVSYAIKSRRLAYNEGEAATEGHIILDVEEKDGIIKVYTIASFGAFGFENGIFTKISGSGAIPTVITFSKNEKGVYSLLEYKEPMDGAFYIDSLKKMFPEKLYDKVISADKYYPELAKQQEAQAAEYLKNIGRTAKVSAAYVEKKLVNINVEASNKLFGGTEFPFLNDYPWWIGTRERIENGIRYIYETSQSKTNDGYDLVIFRKTKEDGTIVKEYRYKIVDSEPQLIYKNTK